MVIPDADSPGPVRKRARLSLKSARKPTTSLPSIPAFETDRDDFHHQMNSQNKCELPDVETATEAEMSNEQTIGHQEEMCVVPAVASLDNLGNTCFLNSVLQILRFTPSFLEGIDSLYRQIINLEKQMKQQKCEEKSSAINDEGIISWDFLKCLFKLYKGMERKEQQHEEVASVDACSMALRPDRLLNIVRDLNPMFEGYLQHDAQELLRCLLCYLQDSERDLCKQRNIHYSQIKDHQNENDRVMSPIMQNFIHSKKERNINWSNKSSALCKDDVKTNLFHDTDIIDDIDKDGNQEIKSCNQFREKSLLESKCVRKNSAVKPSSLDLLNVNCCDNKLNVGGQYELAGDETSLKTVGPSDVKLKLSNFGNGEGDETPDHAKTCQPSILAMFKKGAKACKRLGMRGAVVKKNRTNSNCEENGECVPIVNDVQNDSERCKSKKRYKSGAKKSCGKLVPPQHAKSEEQTDSSTNVSGIKSEEQSECVEKLCGSTNTDNIDLNIECSNEVLSQSKRQKVITSKGGGMSAAIRNSPIKAARCTKENKKVIVSEENEWNLKTAVVKVEKCDLICSSPFTSVNAQYAIDKLTPKREIKKTNLVEKLFQGTMMLRTRCLECESSKQRQEEFLDVSVPLQRQSCDDDDEVEDEKDSCLSKLMAAFSEVERLKDDNKYFCEQCKRHVEAERSLHYETLPDILTLHLKRFQATNGHIGGYVSKINDHVDTPLQLPCLRYKCSKPCFRSDHRYLLYGIITHAGVTISSGHYLAYVKVPKYSSQGVFNVINSKHNSTSPNSLKVEAEHISGASHGNIEQSIGAASKYSDSWLECDDENIRVYSEEDFNKLLLGSDGSILGTPYLLFYRKVTSHL